MSQETALYLGNQKLESIEKAKQGAVSPETLIHYTHRISQASSAVSPVGWHASKQHMYGGACLNIYLPMLKLIRWEMSIV